MIQEQRPQYEVENKKICIFSSHYSTLFSRSILTLEKAEELELNPENDNQGCIPKNTPVSICSIAKLHKLDKLFLIDSSFSGFQEAYRNLTEIETQLIFGIKIFLCDDVADKSDKGSTNDSKIYLIAKNKAGYQELIKIYSEAATNGFYYYPRLDWSQLNKISENIDVWVAFYDGFIYNNLLSYGVSIIPKFDNVKPKFCVENHGLPFDDLIQDGIDKYCKETRFEKVETHQIYYYRDSDAKSMTVYKCINNRSTLNKPQLSHFSTSTFSFESYDSSNPFFNYKI